jgi:hypothetical protein
MMCHLPRSGGIPVAIGGVLLPGIEIVHSCERSDCFAGSGTSLVQSWTLRGESRSMVYGLADEYNQWLRTPKAHHRH